MSNAARVDELWDASAPAPTMPIYLETNKSLQAVISTQRRPAAQPVVLEFEFLGQRIAWTRDGTRQFPEQVLEVLEQIAAFATLPHGWDSYAGQNTELSAVQPALELIFETHRRCRTPRAVPLSGGGIGLRWVSGTFDLDVDVWTGEEINALLTNRETDEDMELSNASVTDLRPMLDQFFSRP